MKYVLTLIFSLFLTTPALAQTLPQCPSGSATSCTNTVHITNVVTPVFARFPARTYLFLQNTGFAFGQAQPVISQNPVFCAIGSNNNPIYDGPNINVMVIEPGGTWEPEQIVKPQNAFTVPAGDVSCVAPLGDVWVTALEE